MNALIHPRPLSGTIAAIPSKSEAHRALICAALADAPTAVECTATSDDIDATVGCLASLGARIERRGETLTVNPIAAGHAGSRMLDCRESGSTLRFLLPIAAALGPCTLTGAGRLSKRPLKPLADALCANGAVLDTDGELPLHVSGTLGPGVFDLPGNVSSQYITGILLAAPVLGGETVVRVAKPVESMPYIELTIQEMGRFGVSVATVEEDGCICYAVERGSSYRTPGSVAIGGDWSNAAFWLAAGALSPEGVGVEGLELRSAQADRAILGALARFGIGVQRSRSRVFVHAGTLSCAEIDVSDCPDLVPAIAPLAALAPGTSAIVGAGRLRLKESDRLESISNALNALGARVSIQQDALVFEGVEQLGGGVVDAANDHRIAMMAAIAATAAAGDVRIEDAECVAKSYPGFFDGLASLGASFSLEV